MGRSVSPKVLVVEDNELNAKLFGDLLKAYNYDVVSTKEGRYAVDLTRKHKPDLIIMDIQLPDVSGLDLARWIKADDELSQIPIMAVTAFAMRADEERVKSAGCEGYMAKPIQIASFIAMVEKLTAPELVQ